MGTVIAERGLLYAHWDGSPGVKEEIEVFFGISTTMTGGGSMSFMNAGRRRTVPHGWWLVRFRDGALVSYPEIEEFRKSLLSYLRHGHP